MNTMETGDRIRELREAAGQSKRFLAKAIGVSYTSICSYEYGIRTPCDGVKIRIAKHFGKTVGEIFFPDDYHEMRTDQ